MREVSSTLTSSAISIGHLGIVVSTAFINRSYNDSFLDEHPHVQVAHYGPSAVPS